MMIATQTTIVSVTPSDRESAFSFLPRAMAQTPGQNNNEQQQHLEWDLPGCMSREQSGIAALQALPSLMSRECSGIAPGIMSRECSGLGLGLAPLLAGMSREVSFGAMPAMSREHSFGTMSREHSGFGGMGGHAGDDLDDCKSEAAAEGKSAAATVSHSSEENVASEPPTRGGLGIEELVTVAASLSNHHNRKADEEEEAEGPDAEINTENTKATRSVDENKKGESEASKSGKRSRKRTAAATPQSAPLDDLINTLKGEGDGDGVFPRNTKKAKRGAAGEQPCTTNRGAHVRERPEMQKNARDGQKHWGSQVREMRRQWADMNMEKHAHFKEQIDMCTSLHIKSQHECLLRQLQMADVEGIIIASKFLKDEKESFLGWTGFKVAEAHGQKFREKIEALFASAPSDKTLNNNFRRAGLVPEHSWAEAWNGIGGFVYDRVKRMQYGGQ